MQHISKREWGISGGITVKRERGSVLSSQTQEA